MTIKLGQEFKAFILRGNVIDFAVGIVIGAAFGKIITTLVNDVIMPPIGMLLGGVNFSELGFELSPATADKAAVVIKYGLFINNIIDFLIISLAIFIMIKLINKAKRVQTATPATTKDCPECLMPVPVLARRCSHCCQILAI
jgi:large conductance mechanosensitive channel